MLFSSKIRSMWMDFIAVFGFRCMKKGRGRRREKEEGMFMSKAMYIYDPISWPTNFFCSMFNVVFVFADVVLVINLNIECLFIMIKTVNKIHFQPSTINQTNVCVCVCLFNLFWPIQTSTNSLKKQNIKLVDKWHM